ncbi:hypothetical protein GLAREA_09349 [Glarea lozoyensis ATCC 20868]|uniref:Uncharacterized protein n=1 Tax=Glarea lozoyensis (strain ATCC 20868 / MF5171) TaxID=1116229 RepID=S3CT46_GLAL2|nr:uncharacterized protein GLAREA_09349 [Glarea lozoyensis ATCC 20868]EPE28229.1 hypothetical protein GLAREA_09349 [Glarea lozoyensis ATCC 20868]
MDFTDEEMLYSDDNVTKRPQKTSSAANTPSSAKFATASPKPNSLSEIQPYDRLLLDGRAANPPVSWKELEVQYRAAGGLTTGANTLRVNQYSMLLALGEEMSKEEIADLVVSEAAVMAEFEKEKWAKVAAHMKGIRGEKNWNAKFLKKTFASLPKGGI